MRRSDMQRGAEVLVRTCAGVRTSESVVIVTDPKCLPIAQAVEGASTEVGGETVILVSPPRQIDNQEPATPVAVAMQKSDVVFLPVSLSLSHTRACRRAVENGARVISMAAFTERMMHEGGLFADFHSRRPLCDHLAEQLTRANEVRLSNPAGTDLRLDLSGRNGNSHSCVLDGPGFTAVPNIEANIAPVEGTAQGTLVADGSIPYYGVGVLQQPVRFDIEDGFVQNISGGAQAAFLRDLLASQNDRFVYNVAQFALGLNPECKEFTGEMLNDEGVNGTIHIGIGTSANLGGETQAKTHFDAIIRTPSVWLDEVCVVEKGKVLSL
ncbi:aminopeptidase [bacterium]|nr:aminopeptidase [bacterium]